MTLSAKDSRALRVLMVSDVYFPRINGVSTSIETYRTALAAHRVEVELIVPRYADEPDSPGITRVAGRKVPGDPEDRLMHHAALRNAVMQAAPRFDIIHIQTPFAAHYAGVAAARQHGKPVIASYHTLFEEYLHHYIPFLPVAWLRALARRFSRGQCNDLNAVVVPSTAMRELLLQYGVARPMHVLPTGLPAQAFIPGEGARFRAHHNISADTPVALFVGRVAHEKNIDFLLDVLQEAHRTHPRLIMLITGEGPALNHVRCRAVALGLHDSVRYLGYLDRRTELPDAYAAADAFVFASRTETQGLVLLEAMAQGCPVVGLSMMGTTDILGPGRGCLVAPDNRQGFAQILTHLLDTPGLRAKLSDEARAFAHEWSDHALAEQLAKVYQGLLPTH